MIACVDSLSYPRREFRQLDYTKFTRGADVIIFAEEAVS
jgi:hypothetical protein